MPERGADAWFEEALRRETDRTKHAEAIEAYERGLRVEPNKVDALLNCGTLYYEQANFEKAADYFRRAIGADPENALAYFNLGSERANLAGVAAEIQRDGFISTIGLRFRFGG